MRGRSARPQGQRCSHYNTGTNQDNIAVGGRSAGAPPTFEIRIRLPQWRRRRARACTILILTSYRFHALQGHPTCTLFIVSPGKYFASKVPCQSVFKPKLHLHDPPFGQLGHVHCKQDTARSQHSHLCENWDPHTDARVRGSSTDGVIRTRTFLTTHTHTYPHSPIQAHTRKTKKKTEGRRGRGSGRAPRGKEHRTGSKLVLCHTIPKSKIHSGTPRKQITRHWAVRQAHQPRSVHLFKTCRREEVGWTPTQNKGKVREEGKPVQAPAI